MCHTFTSMHDRCYDNTCLTEGKYNHYAWNNATQLAMHGTCQTSHIMHGKCQRLTLSIAICKTIVITIVRFCYAWQTHANLEMSNDRHCCMTHAKQKKIMHDMPNIHDKFKTLSLCRCQNRSVMSGVKMHDMFQTFIPMLGKCHAIIIMHDRQQTVNYYTWQMPLTLMFIFVLIKGELKRETSSSSRSSQSCR